MKRCSDCHEMKPLSEYVKKSKHRDGLSYKCRTCQKLYMDEWRAKNRERLRQYDRDAYAANPERKAAYNAAYYAKDVEGQRARVRAWQEANPEIKKASRTRWYTANPDKDKEHTARRRALLASARIEVGISPEALRAILGDQCAYCSTDLIFQRVSKYTPNRATLDHVIPLSRGGDHTWENVVLACWRCNLSKKNKTLEEWLPRLAQLLQPEALVQR